MDETAYLSDYLQNSRREFPVSHHKEKNKFMTVLYFHRCMTVRNVKFCAHSPQYLFSKYLMACE